MMISVLDYSEKQLCCPSGTTVLTVFHAVIILQNVHETSTITDHISSIILISKLSSRNIFHHSCSCLARTNPPSTSLLTGQRLLTKHGIAFTSRTTSSHDQVAVDRQAQQLFDTSHCPFPLHWGGSDEVPSVIETVIETMPRRSEEEDI